MEIGARVETEECQRKQKNQRVKLIAVNVYKLTGLYNPFVSNSIQN